MTYACPSGKRSWTDKGEAKKAMRKAQSTPGGIFPITHIYKCPHCGRFHMSSTPKRRITYP